MEKKSIISRDTLVPISLVLTILTAAFILGGLFSRVTATETRVDKIETKLDSIATKQDLDKLERNLKELFAQ